MSCARDRVGEVVRSRAGKTRVLLIVMTTALMFLVAVVCALVPAGVSSHSTSSALCASKTPGTWGASVAWAAEASSSQKMPEDTVTNEVLDVSIDDLEEADEYLNEQTVQIVGEVVGDRINAEWSEDHYWLTLEARDESDAEVSVYVDEDAAALVDTYGVYGKTGTVLQITGTFNLACAEHEGLSDLHAEKVKVVSEGEKVTEEPNTALFVPGIILVVVGLILVFVFYRLREGQR